MRVCNWSATNGIFKCLQFIKIKPYNNVPCKGALLMQSDHTAEASKVSVLFSLADRPGGLEEVLLVFKKQQISLTHIESRPSKSAPNQYDFMAEFLTTSGDTVDRLQGALASSVDRFQVVSTHPHLTRTEVPWFPRRMADLDSFAAKTLEYGGELSADHPGFTDDVYRARRAEITAIASTYRSGREIPRIAYTEQENSTWRAVYTQLKHLYPTHACREHQHVFPLLEQNCGYGPDAIPQLEDVSQFLRECTGFTLRPVMGLLSSRDFLNGLAFRVFHSTQYIRHHSKPFYTPEPDVCHELLGHVPLFADRAFASFSQEIGLCSLGASDADIDKLATIYWFTIEFGLCRQDGQLRAYGAGLLSSFGELEYCLSGQPETHPFECAKTSVQSYPITQFQPLYFVADSFHDAQARVRQYSATLKRPFVVRYDPYTQTIDVLNSNTKVHSVLVGIRTDLEKLIESLQVAG